MKLLILLLLISINGFGQNKKYKNITISGNEQMLPVFIQVKHSVELKDTIKLSPDLELILGTGCFGVDMIHIKGTNYYLPISGRGDSMWLYINPKPNGSSQKVHNNWNIGNAVMTFKSPFDDDTTKIESGSGEFTTPSASFTLPDAARKVFDKPQSKTDTVKGWIKYWKVEIQSYMGIKIDTGKLVGTNARIAYGHYQSIADTSLFEIKEMAVAVYDVTVEQLPHTTCLGCLDDLMVHVGEVKHLSKILVKGKPFDLSKHYEFLRDDEIVK